MDLSDCKISSLKSSGCYGIIYSQTLQILDLSGNRISDITLFGEAILMSKVLKSLDLSRNCIKTKGLPPKKCFIQRLPLSTPLEFLGLRQNFIPPQSGRPIAEGLLLHLRKRKLFPAKWVGRSLYVDISQNFVGEKLAKSIGGSNAGNKSMAAKWLKHYDAEVWNERVEVLEEDFTVI